MALPLGQRKTVRSLVYRFSHDPLFLARQRVKAGGLQDSRISICKDYPIKGLMTGSCQVSMWHVAMGLDILKIFLTNSDVLTEDGCALVILVGRKGGASTNRQMDRYIVFRGYSRALSAATQPNRKGGVLWVRYGDFAALICVTL